MKHSSLGTRRVISSIITRNFFVTRNKQPMTIGTNRMCISRDDNCVTTMCFRFHDNSRLQENSLRLFAFVAFDVCVCDTSCPIGKLPFSCLLCDEFLKNSKESNWVAVAFRSYCALAITVLDSMKNVFIPWSQIAAPADAILFTLKIINDITSCFAKSFPLPHLLFPHLLFWHLLNQTPFSCIGHL